MAVIYTPAAGAATEPATGNVGASVTLTMPPSGDYLAGLIVITSVTCSHKSQMVNGGAGLNLSWAGPTFTFSDRFLDLFPRNFKYSKAYDIETVRWNDIELGSPVIAANGSTARITTTDAYKYRIGQYVDVFVDELVPGNKSKLNGTMKIVSIGIHKNNDNIGEDDTFKEFTVELPKNVTGSFTLRTGAYNTYHTCNRVRYIKQIDSKVQADKLSTVYGYVPSTTPIVITFEVKYTATAVSSSTGTPMVTTGTGTWAYTLSPNFDLSMTYLSDVSNSTADAIRAAAYNSKLGIV